MLHIRLRRIGKKKQPTYRLIVCEKSKDPFGDYLENLGTYNPRTTPSEINLKADRISEWISKGAQCSDTVWNILVDQGVVKGEKRKSIQISTKRKGKLEKKSADKAVADEAKKVADEAAKAEQDAAKEAEEAVKAEEATKEAEASVEAAPEQEAEAAAPEAEVPSEPVEEKPAEEAPAEEKSPSVEAPGDEAPKAESSSAEASEDK